MKRTLRLAGRLLAALEDRIDLLEGNEATQPLAEALREVQAERQRIADEAIQGRPSRRAVVEAEEPKA